MICPFCEASKVIKDGFTNAGSQRLRCKNCGKRFVIDTKYQGYNDPKILEAARLRLNGKTLRQIGKKLGINHQTVSNWLSSSHAGEGLVYLMHDGERYKIGKTKYINSRMLNVSNEIGKRVKLLHLIHSDEYDILERKLHDKFQRKNPEGEWFRLDQADIEYIKSL